MIENGVLVGLDGQPLFWHRPENRDSISLPDSAELWKQFWDNKENVLGFAHSHPGEGIPAPSWTDITTFSGIELALGKRISWWITTSNFLVICKWSGGHKYDYNVELISEDFSWLEELKIISNA